ncbi:MAG: hypothetical protein HY678_04225 [Chloroflexi bacterium]|nr:hypothetical protein [Chloroflexota bacterium]
MNTLMDPEDAARIAGERPPVLEVEDVTKTYASQPPVTALRGVTLNVHAGELLAIVGPS